MRYPVQARVSFQWKDEGGDLRQGEGTTRDISEAGAFVFAPDCPPVGADVELRISLVELPQATSPLPIELAGQVLRIDQDSEGERSRGFAVLTWRAILHENQESCGGRKP